MTGAILPLPLGVDRDKFNLVHYLVVHRHTLFNILLAFCFTHLS